MTDVVICVMVYPAKTDGLDADKKHRAWRRGDIVGVYPASALVEAPSLLIRPDGTGPGRMRHIRVTGVPATVKTINRVIGQEVEEGDALNPGRSMWKGDPVRLLANYPVLYAQLRDEGEITVTWSQVKRLLKRRSGVDIEDGELA